MPKWMSPIFIVLLPIIIFLSGCNGDESGNGNKIPTDSTQSIDSVISKKKRVSDLTQDIIKRYAKTNSCYLPLLADSSYFNPDSKTGFTFLELFNQTLTGNHPYRNRYLVADMNVLDDSLKSRGFEEINPILREMYDFRGVDAKIMDILEKEERSSNNIDEIIKALDAISDTTQRKLLVNFVNKVWKYRTPALRRKFNVNNSKAYAAGQRLCLCEAREDTLVEVARFAISGKNYEPLGNGRGLVQYLPIGHRRRYYGDLYQITSKNWEQERKYEAIDIEHDNNVGGGNNQITFYKGRVELANFLLMKPHESYPSAVRQNGIHEVALRELARGMLGSSNSIGCIRVSAYASKFVRWWVPQNANFFILYQSDKYYKELEGMDAEEMLPFKSAEEGNRFRAWVNDNLPHVANMFDLDRTGDYRNGYVLDVYYLYGELYEKSKK
jgi:hypothetical protein